MGGCEQGLEYVLAGAGVSTASLLEKQALGGA
jgi:hypothetical protein